MSNAPQRSRFKGWLVVVATIITAIGGLISIPVAIHSCQTANVAQCLNIISVEVQWQSLLDGYNEVDAQLLEFEKAFKMQRDGPEVKTLSELDERLSTLKIPPKAALLYRKRFEKYESLRNAAAQYSPFKSRLAQVNFKLPSEARLPAPTVVGPIVQTKVKEN